MTARTTIRLLPCKHTHRGCSEKTWPPRVIYTPLLTAPSWIVWFYIGNDSGPGHVAQTSRDSCAVVAKKRRMIRCSQLAIANEVQRPMIHRKLEDAIDKGLAEPSLSQHVDLVDTE